jgi:hypothetical protein
MTMKSTFTIEVKNGGIWTTFFAGDYQEMYIIPDPNRTPADDEKPAVNQIYDLLIELYDKELRRLSLEAEKALWKPGSKRFIKP